MRFLVNCDGLDSDEQDGPDGSLPGDGANELVHRKKHDNEGHHGTLVVNDDRP